jgi:hypothetical protein
MSHNHFALKCIHFRIRVTLFFALLKLDYHEHVTKHFEKLTKKHETTLEILKDLKFKSDISEYQAI